MELIACRADEFEDSNAATGEQLNGWISDNWDAIHAVYTLMTTRRDYAEDEEEAWYHTWTNMEPYGGNDGAIVDLRIVEDGRLELVVVDDDYEEYSELLEVSI